MDQEIKKERNMSKNRQSKDIKKNLYQELNRVVDKIRINYQPEKIILFGSLAVGVPSRTSDIDLAIIKKTKKRFLDRNLEVALIADPLEAFDFLVYTPNEWQEMQKKDNYFIREINRGKILYEKRIDRKMA